MKSFPQYFLSIFLLTSFVFTALPGRSQNAPTRMLLVFDCSNSMKAKWGKTDRMTGAKNVLIKVVDSLKNIPNLEMALRCYGHQDPVEKHNCQDSKLEVPFRKGNAADIISFVKNVKPNGYTPIAYSLAESAHDFPSTPGRNIIVLVTDGIEECGGNACEVSQSLQSKNIFVKPYIIGIGFNHETIKFFDCVGTYYDPQSETELDKVFTSVVKQALDKTTVEVYLNDQKGQPRTTDVSMVFQNAGNGKLETVLYQTLNEAVLPDTFSLNPSNTYSLKVFTTPPLSKTGVKLQKEQNNIIKLNASVGNLRISGSEKDYQGLQCVVRQAGRREIVFVQDVNTMRQYLAGNYDLEILTYPRLYFRNVAVTPEKNYSLSLSPPGRLELNFSKDVVGSLYVVRDNKQEWVTDINLSTDRSKEVYALQQGRYIVVYRPANSHNTSDTREKGFYMSAGGSINVKVD